MLSIYYGKDMEHMETLWKNMVNIWKTHWENMENIMWTGKNGKLWKHNMEKCGRNNMLTGTIKDILG